MNQEPLLLSIHNAILIFISLGLGITTLMLGLKCIWRVEHELDTYLKSVTFGILLQIGQKIIFLFGLGNVRVWSLAIQWLDIAIACVFLIAMMNMYRIIRHLNKEDKK